MTTFPGPPLRFPMRNPHAEIAERFDRSKRTISLRSRRVCATIRKLAP